jgi:hypothetical protein
VSGKSKAAAAREAKLRERLRLAATAKAKAQAETGKHGDRRQREGDLPAGKVLHGLWQRGERCARNITLGKTFTSMVYKHG